MRHETFSGSAPVASPLANDVLGHFADGISLKFPKDRLAAPHTFVQAGTGAGKTSTVCRMVEAGWDHGIPFMIIDPEGQFAPLRQSCPGTVVIGVEGADVPLTVERVEDVVTEALRNRASFVLQMDGFPTALQQEICAAALRALMAIPPPFWHKRVIAIDEVHLFAPQKGTCESWVPLAEVAARGGRRGCYLILATQRFARVSKDCITQCGNVLVGRNRDMVDLKPAADALGLTVREAGRLAELPPGTFLSRGPDFSEVVAELRVEQPRTILGGLLEDDRHRQHKVLTGEGLIHALQRAAEAERSGKGIHADAKPAARTAKPSGTVLLTTATNEESDVDAGILNILATARSRAMLAALVILLRGRHSEQTISGTMKELHRCGLVSGLKHFMITEAGREWLKLAVALTSSIAELVGELRRSLHPDALRLLDGLSAATEPLDLDKISERTGLSARSRKVQQHLFSLSKRGLVKRQHGRFAVSVGYAGMIAL